MTYTGKPLPYNEGKLILKTMNKEHKKQHYINGELAKSAKTINVQGRTIVELSKCNREWFIKNEAQTIQISLLEKRIREIENKQLTAA